MRKCTIVDCNRKHNAFGYCLMHYRRFKKYGEVNKIILTPDNTYKSCTFLGCNKSNHSKGYCSSHAWKIWKYGDPTVDKTKRVADPIEAKRISKRKYKKTRKGIEANARREATKRNACPSWLSREQIKLMQDIYASCPKDYHVDHIIPLKACKNGEHIASGLHVPWNLQHLPAMENLKKNNKL